jgi:hypothetical protein
MKKELYQKKFYCDKESEKTVNEYAKALGIGFSEALRKIISSYSLKDVQKILQKEK